MMAIEPEECRKVTSGPNLKPPKTTSLVVHIFEAETTCRLQYVPYVLCDMTFDARHTTGNQCIHFLSQSETVEESRRDRPAYMAFHDPLPSYPRTYCMQLLRLCPTNDATLSSPAPHDMAGAAAVP